MRDSQYFKAEDQVGRIEEVLAEWDQYAQKTSAVARLEMQTMLVQSFDERRKGYSYTGALQGYRQMVRAFQAADSLMDDRQRRGFDYVLQTLGNLEKDYSDSGGDRPTEQAAAAYGRRKATEMNTFDEVYIPAGHSTHFNISHIKKTATGYTYTVYDAGHESEIVRQEGTRAMSYAVREYALKPGVDISQLIACEVLKRGADCEGPEYAALKKKIAGFHDPDPVRVEEDYTQRRGNCTTRGQRIMISDILQDPALAERMHAFISDVDSTGTPRVREVLEHKLARLKHEQKAIEFGVKDPWALHDIETYAKFNDDNNYDFARVSNGKGGSDNVFRTVPGAFTLEQLQIAREKLVAQGMTVSMGRSVSQGGAYYLHVPRDQFSQLREAMKNEDSEAASYCRIYGDRATEMKIAELLADHESYDIVPSSGGLTMRTKLSLFTKEQTEDIQRILEKQMAHSPSSSRESRSNRGFWAVALDCGQDPRNITHMPAMIAAAYMEEKGLKHIHVQDLDVTPDINLTAPEAPPAAPPPQEGVGRDFFRAVRALGDSVASMLPSIGRRPGPGQPGSGSKP